MSESHEQIRIEKERLRFKSLLAENPNYFGNLVDSPFEAVQPMTANTRYEELTCVGYNPRARLLEATFAVKLPVGYGGGLCTPGSREYVRFYVEDGGGWKDVGLVAVNVHDIPTEKDCAGRSEKPLIYSATLAYAPRARRCERPQLPRVRAILSWQQEPPGDQPNWLPVWGGRLECHVQIQPRRRLFKDILDDLDLSPEVKIPQVYQPALDVELPLPQPDAAPLGEMVEIYENAGEIGRQVEAHRLGFADLTAVTQSDTLGQEEIQAKISQWKDLGLDWQKACAALSETQANVSYEELECLGLDYHLERLVATFRVKRPFGYSGDLCSRGSLEYVAFWADWEDTCKWKYQGTVAVNVHDIHPLPDGGLCYTAVLPVNLAFHRRSCEEPRVGRVRAVLSWNKKPSTTDPDKLEAWGNRLDAHVQIQPGEQVDPKNPKPVIGVLGGIPISKIGPADGLTTNDAFFALNGLPPDPWGRSCPFGARVVLQGPSFVGYKYRVQVKKVTDVAWTTVTTTMTLTDLTGTLFTTQQADAGGLFTFVQPSLNIDNVLAWWDTGGDDLWEIRLQLADLAGNILPGVASHRIQLHNSGPDAEIHIDNGGDCGFFSPGAVLDGHFVARSPYLRNWSLGTSPFAAPAGQLAPASGIVQTAPAPGDAWTLNTAGMQPCGYVIRVGVRDRVILNSASVGHYNQDESGFCLQEAGS